MKLASNTWVYSGFPVEVPVYPRRDAMERIETIDHEGIEIGSTEIGFVEPDRIARDTYLHVKPLEAVGSGQ